MAKKKKKIAWDTVLPVNAQAYCCFSIDISDFENEIQAAPLLVETAELLKDEPGLRTATRKRLVFEGVLPNGLARRCQNKLFKADDFDGDSGFQAYVMPLANLRSDFELSVTAHADTPFGLFFNNIPRYEGLFEYDFEEVSFEFAMENSYISPIQMSVASEGELDLFSGAVIVAVVASSSRSNEPNRAFLRAQAKDVLPQLRNLGATVSPHFEGVSFNPRLRRQTCQIKMIITKPLALRLLNKGLEYISENCG